MKMHQIILSAASGQHGRIVLIDLFRHHHQRPAQQVLIASIDLFLQNSQKLFKIGLGLFRRHLILHPCRGRPFPLGVDKGKGIIKSCLSYYIQRLQKILPRLSRKTYDDIGRDRDVRDCLSQLADNLQIPCLIIMPISSASAAGRFRTEGADENAGTPSGSSSSRRSVHQTSPWDGKS